MTPLTKFWATISQEIEPKFRAANLEKVALPPFRQKAVELGLIDEIGGLSDALECLHKMIEAGKSDSAPSP